MTPTCEQLRTMTREQLGNAYLVLVGYDPFKETPPADPPVSTEEMRQVLTEYVAILTQGGPP